MTEYTAECVTHANSFVDGGIVTGTLWRRLDFTQAWVDGGLSPAGNIGPYLHAPYPENETTHRVYPRVPAIACVPDNASGAWVWVCAVENEEDVK